MNNEVTDDDSPEHHRKRSEFIRHLVQLPVGTPILPDKYRGSIPKTIVQFWHNLDDVPGDIENCISSWKAWSAKGFTHQLFEEKTAKTFIRNSLGLRHLHAFESCYHPAMKADYFRLCYLLIEGGFYVDADDVYIGGNIDPFFEDSRLKLQPLCYDISSGSMIKPSTFLSPGSCDPNWIFYFNNNPIIAGRRHPIIEMALSQATTRLDFVENDELPEIQSTTGPGIISKSIFDIFRNIEDDIESSFLVLKDWESIANSQWPLSYRNDSRNWRLSNKKRFTDERGEK